MALCPFLQKRPELWMCLFLAQGHRPSECQHQTELGSSGYKIHTPTQPPRASQRVPRATRFHQSYLEMSDLSLFLRLVISHQTCYNGFHIRYSVSSFLSLPPPSTAAGVLFLQDFIPWTLREQHCMCGKLLIGMWGPLQPGPTCSSILTLQDSEPHLHSRHSTFSPPSTQDISESVAREGWGEGGEMHVLCPLNLSYIKKGQAISN